MTQPTPRDIPRIAATSESAYRAGLQVPVPRGPIGVEKPQDDDVPLVEMAKAAARRTNTVGALLDPYVPKDGPADAPANWNPFSFYKTHEKQFADIAPYVLKGQFDAIFSERDFLSKADVLRRQINDQRTLERGGTVGLITELGVGLFDPTNLLPIMPLNAASRFGNALRLGASLSGQAALQEGILHAVDPTRTGTETAMGIVGAGVLGAGIGSFYKHFDVAGTRFHPDHPENPLRPENLDDATVVSRGVPSSGSSRATAFSSRTASSRPAHSAY